MRPKLASLVLSLGASLAIPASSDAGTIRCSNGIYIAAPRIASLSASSEKFFARLAEASIRDVFFYRIGDDLPRVVSFAESLRKAVPKVRLVAMLGYDTCPQSRCVKIELLHEKLAGVTARYWSAGFDGVQLDLEPVVSGDAGYPNLLRKIHASKPAGKFVSVAGYFVDPPPDLRSLQKPAPGTRGTLRSWTADYYRRVLAHVDQVMVMNYDTAIRSADAYRRFTSWQVSRIRELAPPNVEIQFGLPSDVPRRTGFYDDSSETLSAGTGGVQDALRGLPACPRDFGVTIFTEEGMKGEPDWIDFASAFAGR
jgi:hypothetical protein